MKVFYKGEWLNGRAAVSKTAGCVFESRLPCQKEFGRHVRSGSYLFLPLFPTLN